MIRVTMTTARDIYNVMKADAAASGVDIDDFIDFADDSDGHVLSLLRGEVMCRQEITGEWTVTGYHEYRRVLPADMPAANIATVVTAALLDADDGEV